MIYLKGQILKQVNKILKQGAKTAETIYFQWPYRSVSQQNVKRGQFILNKYTNKVQIKMVGEYTQDGMLPMTVRGLIVVIQSTVGCKYAALFFLDSHRYLFLVILRLVFTSCA